LIGVDRPLFFLAARTVFDPERTLFDGLSRCAYGTTASFNEQAIVAHSQSGFIIRPFKRGDALKARQLIETVWHEHFGYHPDPFVRDFIYSRLSDIDEAETVYGDQAIFLCAVVEAEIIGTGAIKHLDSRECEMTRMFVASAYRGRGIGRAIAEELIKFALSARDTIRYACPATKS